MSRVANSQKVQEELAMRYRISDKAAFISIPTTPSTRSLSSEIDMAVERGRLPLHSDESMQSPSSASATDPAAQHSDMDKPHGEEGKATDADAGILEDEGEDPYASLDPTTNLAIPITNPSAFPVQRLQEVQAQYQPSTHITNMLCHKTPTGPITLVTADIQDGSINHLLIRDARLISALGLAAPAYDTITMDLTKLRIDETFIVQILPGQRPQKLDEWIVAELVSARHAYLYWLDERKTADPKTAPYATEAKAIARNTGRRWPDVMNEIEKVWKLEQGVDGAEYRGNRAMYLGEDPLYPVGAEEGRVVRSLFG